MTSLHKHNHPRRDILLAITIIACFAVFFFIITRNTQPVILDAALTPEIPAPLADSEEVPLLSQSGEYTLTSTNIIWFTNKYRTEHGLHPLMLNTSLRDSAYHKSQDMFRHNYFAHERPHNGMGFDNFVDNQDYVFIKIAENLARGNFTTSKEVVDAWMKSDTHRNNILDPAYTEIGVSVDYGTINGESTIIITQHFGRPKHTCPEVDRSLYSEIQVFNQTLTYLKERIDREEQVDALIEQYNNIIKQRTGRVAEYNDQVRAFDACIIKG